MARTDQCGFRPGTAETPWCGITVYHQVGSLKSDGWIFDGYLFDGSTMAWQSRCATANGNYAGCYEPKVLYNAANNNYVVWINGESATPLTSDTEYVMVCQTPTGGATPTTPGTNCTGPTTPTLPTAAPGPPGLFTDASGNGYLVYDDLANDYEVHVIALNSTYTAPTGSATDVGVQGEGLSAVVFNNRTYVFYGAKGCGYCNTASLSYISASTPLGTYSGAFQINSNSCQGQPNHGADLLTINGAPTVLFATDQWAAPSGGAGLSNQGLGNIYFRTLTFAGASPAVINPLSCDPVAYIPDQTPITQPQPAGADQSDIADAFLDVCDITSTNFRLQTFTPTRATVTSISLPLMRNNTTCAVGSNGCNEPNANLTLSLVSLDGSSNPVSTLASTTITELSLSWSSRWTTWNVGQAVTSGTSYGLELSTTATVGCFGTSISASGGVTPYANGVERVSVSGGSSWSSESGRSFMFSTNWLLRRDLDPASNDNAPVWLNEAA